TIGRLDTQGNFEGLSLWTNPPEGLRTWPRPVVSDDQGKFTVQGIGRGQGLYLGVRDLRYARQELHVNPDGASAGKEITLALEPARIIEGRVLADDTGRPIPHAIVSASYNVRNEHANGIFTAKFRADAEGRFTMNPTASDKYTLGAFPTGGEPYLIQQDK